jgi:hypothetical protein
MSVRAKEIQIKDGVYARMCSDRVQASKKRQMIRKLLLSGGILMLLSASVATQDLTVVGMTAFTFAKGAVAYKHSILDGYRRDGEGCVPIPQHSFEVREAPGKGMGLFTTSNIPKDKFLMRYEGERINELELELLHADNPVSDKVMTTHH